MSTALTVFLIIGAVLVLLLMMLVQMYNSLVRLKALTDEGWSGIDVQLKRRYDLIPNLVAVVKQYSIHEKELLEKVAELRSASMKTTDVAQKSLNESQISSTLKTLFAVAENYPNLKANENFMSLQKDLGVLEEEIQLARRYYNGAARNYNISVRSFPSNMVAGMTGFAAVAYFELDNPAERTNPKITF